MKEGHWSDVCRWKKPKCLRYTLLAAENLVLSEPKMNSEIPDLS